ncbi:MAG: DUF1015 domain-containing protein [Gammaproteobacteria bacterium]|nr:DUF1015 domain-containing protein [Gammaproteobacteria bacterium]
MPQIKKFDGLLVNPEKIDQVVTPSYDAMTPTERRTFAEQNPGNYVNVMRTLEEFDGNGPTLEEILNHNQTHLNKLLDRGAFIRTEIPAYFLYQLRLGSHEQTGVIATIPVEEYTSGRLKKHEDTQLNKENMLTHYQQTVGVTSSPICVGYPDQEEIDDAVARAKLASPCLEFSAWDNVEQSIWRIDDADISAQLEQGFNQIVYTYLTDGHHRCAAGARIAQSAKNQNSDAADSNSRRLFVALFPESQLRIFSYFRCVRDLGGLSVDEMLNGIRSTGIDVQELNAGRDNGLLPSQARHITMTVDDRIFELQIPESMVPSDDPVRSLDVSILQEHVLSGVLNIHDARSDSRLSYVPGSDGISGLMDRCSQGWRLGFACVDTTMQEVMDVADAGCVMPPKSTWFDPKLRSGIFLQFC